MYTDFDIYKIFAKESKANKDKNFSFFASVIIIILLFALLFVFVVKDVESLPTVYQDVNGVVHKVIMDDGREFSSLEDAGLKSGSRYHLIYCEPSWLDE